MIRILIGSISSAMTLTIMTGRPSPAPKSGEGFSNWLSLLEPWSWLATIIAALVGLGAIFGFFRPVLTSLWYATPWMETKRLNDLGRAMTLSDFEKTLRTKEAGSRNFSRLGLDNRANLTSKFYILPRTYVEAFVEPNSNVYGYSIMLRRPGWLGTIRASHYRVKLGRTTFRSLPPRGTIVTPSQRGFAYFEVQQSSKVTSYKGFAAGISSGNPGGRAFSSYLIAFPRIIAILGRIGEVRENCQGFEERMKQGLRSIQNHYSLTGEHIVLPHADFVGTPNYDLWRNNVKINYISVAHQGDVLLNMINCHGDLIQNFDYRDLPRQFKGSTRYQRFRLLGYQRLIDYLLADR